MHNHRNPVSVNINTCWCSSCHFGVIVYQPFCHFSFSVILYQVVYYWGICEAERLLMFPGVQRHFAGRV